MRRPLAWLIVFEILVVAALVAATYHLLAARAAPAPAVAAAPALPAPKSHAPKATPSPTRRPAPSAVPSPTIRPGGPPPGLSFDPAFWAGQLQRINHDQHALEQLQWQVTRGVTG